MKILIFVDRVSHIHTDIINELISNGYQVVTLDPMNLNNKPKILSNSKKHTINNSNVLSNYTINDIDFFKSLITIVKECDYILPSWSERLSVVISDINQKYKLPGISKFAAKISSSKVHYYEVFDKLGILYPKTYQILADYKSNIDLDNIKFPCVIKPAWGVAGINVILINDKQELENFFKDSDKFSTFEFTGIKDPRYIIQEYINGDIGSIMGVIKNNMIHINLSYDLLTNSLPYFPEAGAKYPSQYNQLINNNIVPKLQDFFNYIKLDNSPFMLDFIVKDGNAYFIDFGARINFTGTMLSRWAGEPCYISKLVEYMVNDVPLDLNFSRSVIFKQFDLPLGDIESITCAKESLADKIHLSKKIICPTSDGLVYNNCYAVVTGNTLSEAKLKIDMIEKSINIKYI